MANEAITITNDNWTLTGTVVNTNTSRRANGVTVEVFDKDRIGRDDALGTALTNIEGEFSVTFHKSDFRELVFDNKPDLYFKISLNGSQLLDTSANPIMNADENTPRITLEVSY